MNRALLTRALAAVVALALVVGLVAWLGGRREAVAAYVTAPVVRGDVRQVHVASGSVERDNQVRLDFETPGTVTAVLVKVGDRVEAGTTLALTDPEPLRLQVLQARAGLLQAEATLDADRRAKDSGGSSLPVALPTAAAPGGTGSGGSSSGGSGIPTGGSAPGSATPPPAIAGLQTSLAALQAAVIRQQQVCQPLFAAAGALPTALPTAFPTTLPTALPTTLPTALPTTLPSGHPTALPSGHPTSLPTALPSGHPTHPAHPSPTPEPSPTPSPEPAESPEATPTPTPKPAEPTGLTVPDLPSLDELRALVAGVRACSDAMVALAGAEQAAGQAIAAAAAELGAANAAAARQLQEAAAQAQRAAVEAARAAAEQAMAEAQRALAEQLAGQFGRPVTDATLAADRARVLEARQRLDRADRALGNATLTSPVAGVVGSLDLRRGESSVGRSVVVVGDGAARMTIEVPLSLRALVSPGLDAGVGGLGSRRDLPGRVTSVSVVPTSPTGTPTYTATIVVDDPDQTLRGGTRAEAELTLRTAADVLTIPVSAATRTADDTATVEVVTGATATTAEVVAVETGTVGTSHLEVLSGLEAGQLVVLADRRLPVPGGLSQYQALRPGSTPTPTPGR